MVPENNSDNEAHENSSDSEEEAANAGSKKRLTCIIIAVIFVAGAIGGIFALTAWDAKSARMYEGEPLPENVGYIGRWVSDGTIAVRLNTFAIAGDRLACDFSVRNDADRTITVEAIGRTILRQFTRNWLSMDKMPLNLTANDRPMAVTDNNSVLGMGSALGLPPMRLQGEGTPEPPSAFSLQPGELERFRYRPPAHRAIMPASTLRMALKLQDESSPHPFYFLRKSAGVGGWFEQGAEKLVKGSR